MTRECGTCGDPLDADRDKAGGRYRDDCMPCIRERVRPRERHVDTCEDGACVVCRDYREEFGTERTETDQATVRAWL